MSLREQIASLFRTDPVGYCKVVLGATLTPDQERILGLLVQPPYKVLVKSANLTGKSFLAACATLWWYDTHDPGIVLTTAPNFPQTAIVWKEIRRLRGPWGGFQGPKANVLQSHPKHYAKGYTARDATAFQGHHEENVFIIFDEAVGVEAEFWEAAETMLCGKSYAFLAIFNPTDQGSCAYNAEQSGHYHVVSLGALSHPNIAAELAGQEAPFPAAIRLGRLDELIRQWCQPLQEPPLAGDIEWPPGSGKFWRPGPEAEARLLGRWPSLANNSVWTEAIWERCLKPLPDDGPIQIGVDVARFGSDDTTIHTRKGRCSIAHESHNGWSTSQTAARLRQWAEELAQRYQTDPRAILIAVDDCGVGGGVVDQANGYNFKPVNAASEAHQRDRYPNKRSELWFTLADEAARGNVSFARLPDRVKADLRFELLAPTYSLDYQGRRVVERKADTKKRLKRSPDVADSVHLAYCRPTRVLSPEAPTSRPAPKEDFLWQGL